MSSWIKTDTYDLSTRRGKEKVPKTFSLMLSPYDVPNALRAVHDNGCLIIEFRYINIEEEHFSYDGDDDGVSFEVGRKTQRIYRIFVDLEKLHSTDSIVLQQNGPIESAIEQFISNQESQEIRTAKYSATRSAINDYKNVLMASI